MYQLHLDFDMIPAISANLIPFVFKSGSLYIQLEIESRMYMPKSKK